MLRRTESEMPRLSSSLPMIALFLPALALAEGSSDLVAVDRTLPETVIFVDVLDAGVETITYLGDQEVSVFTPSGAFLRTVVNGEVIEPVAGSGTYRFQFDRIAGFWDIEVSGRNGGRVWSPDWRFDAGSFRQGDAISASFYALVDGGQAGRQGVIELRPEGLAGYVFRVSGTSTGLGLANGRSVEDRQQRYRDEYPIYLHRPEGVAHDPVTPVLSGLTVDVTIGTCDLLVPDVNTASISFESNVDGTLHLLCDLDGDGVFDMSSDDDLHVIASMVSGTNTLEFDGYGNDALALEPGTYDCKVRATTGELHYVVDDVETLYPGLRMFAVDEVGARTGLSMFWNDSEVQSGDIDMPNGVPGAVSSGPTGVSSGVYATATNPLTNARAWGAFVAGSKGDNAWMDTYTWLSSADTEVVTITVGADRLDTDGDGLFDVEEECETGTDPLLVDTDADGIDDRTEVRRSESDPTVYDTDGDCVPDGLEVDEQGRPIDTDGDGIDNAFDPDDDDDGIPSCVEYEGQEYDYDGDGRANHLDLDADGDLFSDEREGIGDRDGDGRMDFLDADTVGFGLIDVAEGFYAGGCATAPAGGRAALGWSIGLFAALALRRRRSG